MLSKLLINGIITLLILDMSTPLEIQAKRKVTKNSLMYKFCIGTLKRKVHLKKKKNFNEISTYTCECFLKTYNSGTSFKGSRIHCKNKASEKYFINHIYSF